jgi:uncharacterized protein (DUF2267 family)
MKVEEFLDIVREGLGLDDLKEADKVVRVVVGALKATLPEDRAASIADALPDGLAAGWEDVAPLPEDMLERAELYLEEDEEPRPPREQIPTITQG